MNARWWQSIQSEPELAAAIAKRPDMLGAINKLTRRAGGRPPVMRPCKRCGAVRSARDLRYVHPAHCAGLKPL